MKIVLLCSFIFFLVSCKTNQSQVYVATEYINRSVEVHQKPGADIELRESQVNLTVSGAQYAIEVNIDHAYSDAEMTLSVRPSSGLHVVGGDTSALIPLAGQPVTLPYDVIAEELGRYYLYFNAVVRKDGKLESRALTLIVQVGEESEVEVVKGGVGTMKKSGESGELIITLPAQEEIIR